MAQQTGVAGQQRPISTVKDGRLIGVGSCTAVGCHGGGRPDRIVGSEYNIWIAEDPHSRAYSTLFDDRSRRMIHLLDAVPANAPAAAHEDPRCLACHSMTHAKPKDLRHDVMSDGVGCEACHGPAENWLSPHFQRTLTPGEREQLGMLNTNRLNVRTQACVSCHVGGPGREVNHDLIAAGHPRLQFEMGTYFEALPKHWLDVEDRKDRELHFDASLWAIGQACTSQAALEQLARRAESGSTWPEFAEWSCSACHHDLRDDRTRQQRLADEQGLSGRRIAWDAWNHFLSRDHATDLSRAFDLNADSALQVETKIKLIEEQMRSIVANRQKVANLARSTAAELGQFAAELEKPRIDRPRLDRLTRSILSAQRAKLESGTADWSAAAQTYDALASLHEARLQSSPENNAELTRAIRQMYEDLAAKQRTPTSYLFQPAKISQQLTEIEEQLPPQDGEQ